MNTEQGLDQHNSITTEVYTQCKDTDQPSAALVNTGLERSLSGLSPPLKAVGYDLSPPFGGLKRTGDEARPSPHRWRARLGARSRYSPTYPFVDWLDEGR